MQGGWGWMGNSKNLPTAPALGYTAIVYAFEKMYSLTYAHKLTIEETARKAQPDKMCRLVPRWTDNYYVIYQQIRLMQFSLGFSLFVSVRARVCQLKMGKSLFLGGSTEYRKKKNTSWNCWAHCFGFSVCPSLFTNFNYFWVLQRLLFSNVSQPCFDSSIYLLFE